MMAECPSFEPFSFSDNIIHTAFRALFYVIMMRLFVKINTRLHICVWQKNDPLMRICMELENERVIITLRR